MGFFYNCGIRKIVTGVPTILAAGLILYIAFVFTFEFIPYRWPEFSILRLLV